MPKNLTEKILAAHCGRSSVSPGEIVEVAADMVFTHDVFGPYVIEEFRKLGKKSVWDPGKIVFIGDHEIPACSIEAREGVHKMISFAREQGIDFLIGEGICHQLMPERGYVRPGDLVLGTDSHTCTYGALGAFATGIGTTDMAALWKKGTIWLKVPEAIQIRTRGKLQRGVSAKDLILHLIGIYRIDGATYNAIELTGDAIGQLSISSRLTVCNMGVEMGAKNIIMEPDEKTEQYLRERMRPGFSYRAIHGDAGAQYAQVRDLDFSEIEPMLSGPRGVDDVKPVQQAAGKKITQAFLGSCTNGRLEDLAIAAEILRNNGGKIAKTLQLIVTPASRSIYLEALRSGIIETFVNAGAIITNPMCGFCSGKIGGVLGKDDICIATNNRNFPGRLGHKDAEVYLAAPASVAASAVAGEITDPRKFN